MSELDPVTFLIVTELLKGSDRSGLLRQSSSVPRNTVSSPTLILLAHGSKDPGWSESLEDLCTHARRDFGPDSVQVAYLQFNSPSLEDVIENLLTRRVHQFRILPLFLWEGKHPSEDIPQQIDDLKQKYAALEVELLAPLGEDPRFQRLLWQIVREQALPDWLARTS